MTDNCIWVDCDDPIDPLFFDVRTARKLWVCGECGDEIKPGYPYEHAHGLYDGVWEDYRTCARCVDVAEGFFQGRIFGGMVEYFLEAHGFDYRDGIPSDFTPCGVAPAVTTLGETTDE